MSAQHVGPTFDEQRARSGPDPSSDSSCDPVSGRPLRWLLMGSHVPAGGAGGGMVRYVVELAAALGRRSDVQLSVTSSSAAAPFFRQLLGGSERVHIMPRDSVLATAAIERLTRRLHEGGPYDVVHGTKHLLPRFAAATHGRSGHRATRVLAVHDMLHRDRPQDFGLLKRMLLDRPYRASVADADALLCVSDATRAKLVDWLPDAAPRCATVPLALSHALVAATPQPVTRLAGRNFALVVGDSSHRKNLPLVVDAWDAVRERVPGAVLAVVGPPSWAGASFGRAFERLVADGHVVHLGRVADEQLRWCYEHTAVTLCPSLLEGFGLPVLEALAFDSPLIVSPDPALVEVADGRAPSVPTDRPDLWVTAISEAMRRPHRDTRARLAADAAATAPARTWDDVAADTVRIARAARLRDRLATASAS